MWGKSTLCKMYEKMWLNYTETGYKKAAKKCTNKLCRNRFQIMKTNYFIFTTAFFKLQVGFDKLRINHRKIQVIFTWEGTVP